MEMKFGIQKYSQVFIVSTGYRRMTMFVDQYVRFPTESYNSSLTEDAFHVHNSTPTSYKINIRVQKFQPLGKKMAW